MAEGNPGQSLLSDAVVNTVVRESALFGGLDREILDRLLALGVLTEFADGEALVTEGEPGTDFFILKEGAVDVCVLKGEGEDRREEQVRNLGPGAVIGEISMLTGRPRTATVRAEGGVVRAVRFAAEDFDKMKADVPDLRDRINRIAVPRTQETMRRLYS